jgi:hypothetical protein
MCKDLKGHARELFQGKLSAVTWRPQRKPRDFSNLTEI